MSHPLIHNGSVKVNSAKDTYVVCTSNVHTFEKNICCFVTIGFLQIYLHNSILSYRKDFPTKNAFIKDGRQTSGLKIRLLAGLKGFQLSNNSNRLGIARYVWSMLCKFYFNYICFGIANWHWHCNFLMSRV